MTARAAIGARSTTCVAPRAASCVAELGVVGGRRDPDGEPGRVRRCRPGQAEHDGRDESRGPGDHFAGPAGTVIVSAGPAWPSAVRRYVAVAFGRTVTANEPSSSGATLTDGTQVPLAASFWSSGAWTSRASPDTTTGLPAGRGRGRAGDAEHPELERGRAETQSGPDVCRLEEDLLAGLLDQGHGCGASRHRRHDDDVDDRSREPECRGKRRRGERARLPAVVGRAGIPRVGAGLEIGQLEPEDVLAGGGAPAGRRVVERRRDLAAVGQDLTLRRLDGRGGRRRLRRDAVVHLAARVGVEVEVAVLDDARERVRARRDGLRLQGGCRPLLRHLARDDPEDVLVEGHRVDDLQRLRDRRWLGARRESPCRRASGSSPCPERRRAVPAAPSRLPATVSFRSGLSTNSPAGSGVTTPDASVTVNATADPILTDGRPSAISTRTVEMAAFESAVPG